MIVSFALNNHDSSYCLYSEEEYDYKYYSAERIENYKNGTLSLGGIHRGFIKKDFTKALVYCDNKNGINQLPEKVLYAKSNLFNKETKTIYQLDHHYAHALSAGINKDNKYIAIDGGGNNGDFFVKNGDKYFWDKLFLGKGFRTLLSGLHIRGSVGKVMGLANYYEELDKSFYDYLLNLKPEKTIDAIIKYVEDVETNEINPTLKKVYTVHTFLSDRIINSFDKNFETGDNIYYGGGCALNINTNTILDKKYNLTICPAANDGGLSIGCMNWMLDKLKIKSTNIIRGTFRIPSPSDENIKKAAKLLAENNIVVFCYGDDEIGPRALGHRSILMNPSIKNGKNYINQQVKHREWWRPFGGSIIDTSILKDYKPSNLDPYMLKSFEFKDEYREMFQSIIHVDNSSRLQIVKEDWNDPFYKLIYYFRELTGIPGLLNTSFNLNGYPIASKKDYCINTFKCMDNVKYMLLGDKFLEK